MYFRMTSGSIKGFLVETYTVRGQGLIRCRGQCLPSYFRSTEAPRKLRKLYDSETMVGVKYNIGGGLKR